MCYLQWDIENPSLVPPLLPVPLHPCHLGPGLPFSGEGSELESSKEMKMQKKKKIYPDKLTTVSLSTTACISDFSLLYV